MRPFDASISHRWLNAVGRTTVSVRCTEMDRCRENLGAQSSPAGIYFTWDTPHGWGVGFLMRIAFIPIGTTNGWDAGVQLNNN